MASLEAFPYTWSPAIDQAVTELSRAHRALRAATTASDQAKRRAEQEAAGVQQ